MYHFIKVHTASTDCTITLARPEKRNAFTPSMIDELAHAISRANADDRVRLVWLKAEGPVFCAGMDLKVFRNPDLDRKNPEIDAVDQSIAEIFESLRKPSIALVEGDVIAGAFLFILGCTYVFTRPEVSFRLPEVSIGLFPFQVMGSLLKVMTEKQALQLCLDPRPFSARRAGELGIVDGFIEDPELGKLAETLRNTEGLAIGKGFEALRRLHTLPASEHSKFLRKALDDLRKQP